MKTFLFSTCILTLLIAVILINACYVRHVTDKFCTELENLPACAQAQTSAQALLARWKKEERLLELSVSATDMNDVENQLTALCVSAHTNDTEAFEHARAICLLGLARIQDLERFRFLHIL